MKTNECLRLANLSLKNHKKQTSNTVIGFTLSLTLLIIVLFLILGINGGVMKKVNSIGAIASLKITYEDTNEDYPPISFHDEIVSNQNTLNIITYSEQRLYYTRLGVNKVYYPTLKIDGKEYIYDFSPNPNAVSISDTFSFYDINDNKSIITKAEEEYLKNKENSEVLISGDYLSGTSNEIMLSSMIIDYFNIDSTTIIGKSFSYSLIQRNIDGEYYTIDYENFKIVGIFNQYLYNSPSRGEDYTSGSLYWLNKCDLSDSNAVSCELVQFKNFKDFFSFYETIPYKQGVTTNTFVKNYQDYSSLIYLILYTFSFFGSVIFMATLINLFNTARYNIKKRKSYLQMCKALGMTSNDIIKMYSFENLIITTKSFLLSIPVSFIISLAIYILSIKILPASNLALNISIALGYYPLAAIIVLLVLGLLSLLIARFTCNVYKYSK